MELFVQKKPGLSSYKDDPKQAANSLRSLLDAAMEVIPKASQSAAVVRVGATAGLRFLKNKDSGEDIAEIILQEVRELLKDYPFATSPDGVKILDGADEGAFAWVTVNYLLGNLGKDFDHTVGMVDLGGGSVQMAYAISDMASQDAPKGFVRSLSGKGVTYNVYVWRYAPSVSSQAFKDVSRSPVRALMVCWPAASKSPQVALHLRRYSNCWIVIAAAAMAVWRLLRSYLGYGLMAARGAVLGLSQDDKGHACLAKGSFKYNDKEYQALARIVGSDHNDCSSLALKALKKDTECTLVKCSFGGIWSGGGGDGRRRLYVASFYFDRAAQLGVVADPDANQAIVKPSQFWDAAQEACALSLAAIPNKYPTVRPDDAPFLCLDVVYQYTLLTAGFDVKPEEEVTLVKKLLYKGNQVEAQWSLGAAIDALS
eukprot:SM000160S02532  [mRNA]  locus=s160:79032:81917:- [translate_table: standard]